MALLRKLAMLLVALVILAHSAALPTAMSDGADGLGAQAWPQNDVADPGEGEQKQTTDHAKPCQDHCQVMLATANTDGRLEASVRDPMPPLKLASIYPSLTVPPPQ